MEDRADNGSGDDYHRNVERDEQENRAQEDQDPPPEEIAALESGMTGEGHEGQVEVAVAAPADIAELEEEANLKAFRQTQGGDDDKKKKKPWWRFGF